jgi:hypothetical protein
MKKPIDPEQYFINKNSVLKRFEKDFGYIETPNFYTKIDSFQVVSKKDAHAECYFNMIMDGKKGGKNSEIRYSTILRTTLIEFNRLWFLKLHLKSFLKVIDECQSPNILKNGWSHLRSAYNDIDIEYSASIKQNHYFALLELFQVLDKMEL